MYYERTLIGKLIKNSYTRAGAPWIKILSYWIQMLMILALIEYINRPADREELFSILMVTTGVAALVVLVDIIHHLVLLRIIKKCVSSIANDLSIKPSDPGYKNVITQVIQTLFEFDEIESAPYVDFIHRKMIN
jgi:hypothetical protein